MMRHAGDPPRLPRRVLEHVVPRGVARDGLIGDLHEFYQERRQMHGRFRADVWYWWECLVAAARYVIASRRSSALVASPVGIGRIDQARVGPGKVWLWRAWMQLRLEVHPALTRLARRPGFMAAAILPLALGIGATATILTLVHDVVLSPLPYPEPDRLVVIRHTLPGYEVDGRVPEMGAFLGQYLYYRERSRLLSEVGAYWTFDGTLTDEAGAEFVRLGGFTASALRALGIRPVEGRLLADDDPWPAETGQGVTLLSHGFWSVRYGGASATGRMVRLQGLSYEIVGVLPRLLPLAQTRPVMWNPIPDGQARKNPAWTVQALVGRLAPGATIQDLERELSSLEAEVVEEFPDETLRTAVERGRMTPRVLPLKEWIVGDVARSGWLTLAAVVLLLLVAFGNVAGLLIVRADAARRELAVRVALGSGRLGLALRILVENALLVGASAVLGLAAARFGVEAMIRTVPTDLPRIETISMGWAEVLFVLVLALLGTGALTVLQLLHVRRGLAGALRDGVRGAGVGSIGLSLRHAFVSSQVALALVLLVGMGLVLRSARSLTRVDPGFPVDSLLTFRVPFPFGEIQAAAVPGITATPFFEEVARRVEALPGVAAVGWGSCAPLSSLCSSGGFAVVPPGNASGAEAPGVSAIQVSAGYRAALGIRLLAGRDLDIPDHRRTTNRVLISQSLAQRLWPDQNPLERSFTPVALFQRSKPRPFTVSGIVADVRFDNLRSEGGSMVFLPVMVAGQPTDLATASFVVRSRVPPLALVEPIRSVVADLRPDIPVAFPETMQASVDRATAGMRFSSWLLTLVAGATLLLAALGIYGMSAYVASLRRPEFGVRLALGATGGHLRRMVLSRGVVTALAGVVPGLIVAATVSKLLHSSLYGVEAVDPPTYAFASGLLLLVTGVAAYVPARRATRVAPSEALRAD